MELDTGRYANNSMESRRQSSRPEPLHPHPSTFNVQHLIQQHEPDKDIIDAESGRFET
jgi:hypothetical protein